MATPADTTITQWVLGVLGTLLASAVIATAEAIRRLFFRMRDQEEATRKILQAIMDIQTDEERCQACRLAENSRLNVRIDQLALRMEDSNDQLAKHMDNRLDRMRDTLVSVIRREVRNGGEEQ